MTRELEFGRPAHIGATRFGTADQRLRRQGFEPFGAEKKNNLE
jgi:hypothetical protein